MTKAEKLRAKGPYCLSAQNPGQPWHGFTLQKGHLYGWSGRDNFVVKSIHDDYIEVRFHSVQVDCPPVCYNCAKSYVPGESHDVWEIRRIKPTSRLGKMIIESAKKYGTEIAYVSEAKQVKGWYNPPITANYRYTNMGHNIPGADRYAQRFGYRNEIILK